MNKTSKLWWIERAGSGRLAIMSRPNSDSLREELQAAKDAGVQEIVSLLTADDVESYKLQDEASIAREVGIKFKRYGIQDHGVPTIDSGLNAFLKATLKDLHSGKAIAIHCNSGKGRSGIISGALMAMEGIEPEEAMRMMRSARHSRVPENDEQDEWLRAFAQQYHPLAKHEETESMNATRLRTAVVIGLVGILGVAAFLGYKASHRKRDWRFVL